MDAADSKGSKIAETQGSRSGNVSSESEAIDLSLERAKRLLDDTWSILSRVSRTRLSSALQTSSSGSVPAPSRSTTSV